MIWNAGKTSGAWFLGPCRLDVRQFAEVRTSEIDTGLSRRGRLPVSNVIGVSRRVGARWRIPVSTDTATDPQREGIDNPGCMQPELLLNLLRALLWRIERPFAGRSPTFGPVR
jgi:hypothetical protein